MLGGREAERRAWHELGASQILPVQTLASANLHNRASMGKGGAEALSGTALKRHNNACLLAYENRYGITTKAKRRSQAVLKKHGRGLKSGGQRWNCRGQRKTYTSTSEASRLEAEYEAPAVPASVKLKLGSRPVDFKSLEDTAKRQISFEDSTQRQRGVRVQGDFLVCVRARSGRKANDIFWKYLVLPKVRQHVLQHQPKYAAALELARVWKIDKNGKRNLCWESPSVVSEWDETVQKLVPDHTEVKLTGMLQGLSDYYLHSFEEWDLNQDIKCAKHLIRNGVWDPQP